MKNFEGFWRMAPYPGQPQASHQTRSLQENGSADVQECAHVLPARGLGIIFCLLPACFAGDAGGAASERAADRVSARPQLGDHQDLHGADRGDAGGREKGGCPRQRRWGWLFAFLIYWPTENTQCQRQAVDCPACSSLLCVRLTSSRPRAGQCGAGVSCCWQVASCRACESISMQCASAGAPIPEDQMKKMAGKRTWADPKVQAFQLDLSRWAQLGRCSCKESGSWREFPHIPAPLGTRSSKCMAATSRRAYPKLEVADCNML